MKQQAWLWSVALGWAAMTFGCAEDPGPAPAPAPSVAPAAVTAPAACATRKPPSRTRAPNTHFTVRPPDADAVKQIARELRGHDLRDGIKLGAMEATPQAFWFTDGTPADVNAAVHKTMEEAAFTHTVPVLVAYNIPHRDCGGLSAGGAQDTASYKAWIDGFAAGIGNRQAVVILEPDSLGLIPNTNNIDSSPDKSCQFLLPNPDGGPPSIPDPTIVDSDRYAQINYAVDALESHAPAASVYLDGTHSAWLNVGEDAARLFKAGVQRAQGFYLDVSNYQFSANLVQFGTWISECLAFGAPSATSADQTIFEACPNEYWNGGPLPTKIATILGEWTGVALDPTGVWSDDSDTAALNTSAINFRYAGMLGTTAPTTHFVIDTSRNGKGPLDTAPFAGAPYNQPSDVVNTLRNGNWCNPPGAGLGLRPTADTDIALLDAYLWVKTPGESDGRCDSTEGSMPRAWDYTQYNPWAVAPAAQGLFDPLWGMVDPTAGLWFSQQATQLARNAVPPLF
jgi:endoglucanase